MTSTNLNRRDFFKGVALTGGVAAAGVLIGCSEAAPAETKQNEHGANSLRRLLFHMRTTILLIRRRNGKKSAMFQKAA